MKPYDIILIGGGIVGLATAWQLKQRWPDAAVLLLEKERALARHQTGRNSGVVHAGVYYAPGSLKADFCRRGAARTIAFCREHGLPFERCGKLLVATNAVEYERMGDLEARCGQNGIDTRRLSATELKRREPRIKGVAALLVAATGITDYIRITGKMAALFRALGGEIRSGCAVGAITEKSRSVIVRAGSETFETGGLLACGGLLADRLARMAGIDVDFQIVPFRGEYYRLAARYHHMVRHLIYPIPDPDLPFLGVHLTRMVDGSVTVGPNAVLGWQREGYGRFNLDLRDSLDTLTFPGFWRVIGQNLVSGVSELKDSLYKPGYLKRVQKYCPALTTADLLPWPAGIRAQAVKKDGRLVHDFLFAETERTLHVCNAPSPAATSAMPIADHLCRKMADKFRL